MLLVYGIVQGGDGESWTSAGVLGPALGGLLVLAPVRLVREPHRPPERSTSGCSRTGRLSASVGSIALLFFGMGGVYFFTSFYLQNVRGYSPLEAGLLAVPFALGQFVLRRAAPRLVDRYGVAGRRRRRACCSTRWRSPATRSLGTASPIWIVAVLFFIQGAGLGAGRPGRDRRRVMDALPRERAGAGSALTNTARQVAVALSVAVLGSILAAVLPQLADPDAGQAAGGARGTRPARPSPPPRRWPRTSATRASSCSPRPTSRSSTPCGSPRAIAAALAVAGRARGAALDAGPAAAYHRGTGRRRRWRRPSATWRERPAVDGSVRRVCPAARQRTGRRVTEPMRQAQSSTPRNRAG